MRCKIEHTMCKQCHEKDEISFRNWYTFDRKNALKTKDCTVVLRHEYVTFQHTLTHTFDTSNSLYESQKAHVYVINILWVIRWGLLQQRQHTESVALVRLSTRCIFSNRQHSSIPRMLAYIQQFFVHSMSLLWKQCFLSCTFEIPNTTWILHEAREKFYGTFFGSRHYCIRRKILAIIFIFNDIFSATHSKLLVQCFLLTLLLIKFASLKHIKHLIHIVTCIAREIAIAAAAIMQTA